MFDARLRRHIDPPLNRLGHALSARGVTANGVTLAGAAVAVLAGLVLSFGLVKLGLLLIVLNRVLDGLDGAVARVSGKTDFGGFLDICADFLFYGLVPFGFLVAAPEQNAVAAGLLLLAFYVNGASFLGFAILAEKRQMESDAQGEKSLYYSNGLLEGAETIAFFVAFCLWPEAFAPLAILFAGLCFVTTALRLNAALHIFIMEKEVT